MIKNTLKAGLVAAACTLSFAANANLITNGSFEDNAVAEGKWKWFTSDKVGNWNGSNIEIWNNFKGETAYDGKQFIELNAHYAKGEKKKAFSIFQEFETIVGETYNVSFAYQARGSKDEAFTAAIFGDADIVSWALNDHTKDGWSVLSASFVADSETAKIQFTSNNGTSTYGNFIDDVKVSASVPEPGTLALLGLGLAGLGLARRRTA